MRRSAPEIREDFIDPTEVWDPELSSPIPKLIGGLLTITLLLAFAVLGIKGHRVLVLSPILGFGYALGDIVPALERLRAFRRYEAWMALERERAPGAEVMRRKGCYQRARQW